MIFIDLILNLSLLVALSVISGFISDKWNKSRKALLMQGILFGTASVLGMLRPFVFSPGLIFDGRSVMLGLCGFFFGPLSVAVAFIMTAALRIYQGGVGAIMGVLVISSSSLIGLIFHIVYIKKMRVVSSASLFVFGLIVHVVMVLLMLTLPSPMNIDVIKQIAPPVLVTYPLAVVLVGRIISENMIRSRYVQALKRSESDLRQSEGRLRTLLQTLPDLVWLKDINGVYLACNSEFERYFGTSESGIIGRTDYDFVDSELADFFRDKDRAAIEAGKPVSNEEWITYPDSGDRVLLETIKTPMYDSSGEIIGVLGIGRNITERKNSAERIENLLAEKELLLREVHHRIKNNMNTIKGLLTLQLLSENNPEVIESLREVENRVQSIIMLYERLYVTENFRELQIRDYLEPLCEMVINSFPNRGAIKFSSGIGDFTLNIQMMTTLGIIVNELVMNIMKHAFTGIDSGEIFLSASLSDSVVTVTVGDNGRGIPDSIDFTSSTGFGLELVGMLVGQLNGEIKIERGIGTRFVLVFSR